MKRLAVLLLALPMAANAGQITIDFEDGTPFDFIGSTYASQGVTFGPSCYFYGEDVLYPASSGVNSAICNPLSAQIDFSSAVSNVGAYFNVYAFPLTFSAYDSGGLLGSITIDPTIQPTPGGPQFYELLFSGIKYVTLTGESGSFYNYDDFTFSVPEPSTLALFGIGLLGIGLARRRRTQ
jgi:hypothetical protein